MIEHMNTPTDQTRDRTGPEWARLLHNTDARRTIGHFAIGNDPQAADDVVSQFRRWLHQQPRHQWATWQEAFNQFTGAAGGYGGTVRYTPTRCQGCRGRRIDYRIGRLCQDCHGTGRARPTVLPVRRIPISETHT